VVDLGSPEIRYAFYDSVSLYQPRMEGLELDLECGSTLASLKNIHKIAESLSLRIARLEIRPVDKVLVIFANGMTYLATGFGFGRDGEGPQGLVQILAEHGFGGPGKTYSDRCRNIEPDIFAVPDMTEGPIVNLLCYQPRLEGVDLEEEGGLASSSLSNLRNVAKNIGLPVSLIEVRPPGKALVVFGADVTYLALGLGVGYIGDGPVALAEFATEQGFGSGNFKARYQENCEFIFGTPERFEGVLFEREAS